MGSGTFVTVLLVILTTALLHRGCLPVIGALREFVRRLKPKECHMLYLDGQSTYVTVVFFQDHCGAGGEYYFVDCVHASSSVL